MQYAKCKGCKSKYEGCHDRCPSYIAHILVSMEEKERRDIEKQKDYQDIAGVNRVKKGRKPIGYI